MALNIIYMLMTHKCIFPAQPSPPSSRLLYPTFCFMSLYIQKHLELNKPQMILLPQTHSCFPLQQMVSWSHALLYMKAQESSQIPSCLSPDKPITRTSINLKSIHFSYPSSATLLFQATQLIETAYELADLYLLFPQ